MSYNTKVMIEANDSKLEFYTGTRKFGRQHGALFPVDGEGVGEVKHLACGMMVKPYLQQLMCEDLGYNMPFILQAFINMINDEYEMVQQYEENQSNRDEILRHNITLSIQLVN